MPRVAKVHHYFILQYQLRQRKQFEDIIPKNRTLITNWLKYAQWEESQKEIQRARSVWDHRDITVSLKYTEMEMRNRQYQLRQRKQFEDIIRKNRTFITSWLKYAQWEESRKEIQGARSVWDHRDITVLLKYTEMEMRNRQYQLRQRKQFEDIIRKNRTFITSWLKYAQWEESQKEIQRARSVLERVLHVVHRYIAVWSKYTEMEMRNRQPARKTSSMKNLIKSTTKKQMTPTLLEITIKNLKFSKSGTVSDKYNRKWENIVCYLDN
ncbi:hypothetical protein JTB14_021468 [Gonioctena quinquepunctata]|nr:hypothetical protein JTB14_021468 [Gonioctena quinquepunctata]